MHELLQAKERIGLSAGPTLVRLDEWLNSIAAGKAEPALDRIASKGGNGTALIIIEDIAADVIQNARGKERKLLSKSLQELLYYCSGFDPDLGYSQFKSRLFKYVRRKGTASIVKQFLALYYFNHVWFEASDSMRAMARNTAAFEKQMALVEQLCRKAVASTWKSFEPVKRPLNLRTAGELLRNIERLLRG